MNNLIGKIDNQPSNNKIVFGFLSFGAAIIITSFIMMTYQISTFSVYEKKIDRLIMIIESQNKLAWQAPI